MALGNVKRNVIIVRPKQFAGRVSWGPELTDECQDAGGIQQTLVIGPTMACAVSS